MEDYKRRKSRLTVGEKAAIAVIIILIIIIILLLFQEEVREYYEVFRNWYEGNK